MTNTIRMFRHLRELKEPAVLATLVGVSGSSYRKPGARLLMAAKGPNLGNVSAGCLEADLQARVQQVLDLGQAQLVQYDLGSELDLVWGTGMGCEGKADLLLEPMLPGRPLPWVHFCTQQLERRRTCALATVVATKGEVAFALGDRFSYDDRNHGLLPMDPTLSIELGRVCIAAREDSSPRRQIFQVPGGEIDLLVEPLIPPMALWIYGAGEPGRILATMASQLGWQIEILDHRPALATSERFPEAEHVRAGHPSETMAQLVLDRLSAAVVLSHVYPKDKEALAYFLKSGAAFVGLQGNRKRSQKMLGELEAEGFEMTEAMRERFYFPVGLDLGAEAPEGIALAILAEIQAVLAGRSGGHLRDRQAAIH
ncbi:MAG: XdhC family protein [Holophaga sp.]|nr:XdhC family protein [Holophaga sp.]